MLSVKSSLFLLVLHFEVMYPFEFLAKKAVISVSIFLLLAGSIAIFLVNKVKKYFFQSVLGFLMSYCLFET